MVECPHPYEVLIKSAWAQQPENRPSAIGMFHLLLVNTFLEMIDVLERVLVTSCTPGAARLEVVDYLLIFPLCCSRH